MIGSRIDTNPGPMLMIQPTLTMAEAWSKDRFAPMLRDTRCLHGKVGDARSRDSGNTILHKALALDTPIPTPSGWTTMGEIEVGALVFDERGKPATVTWINPIEVGRPCYRVTFCDGSSVVTDAEHLWYAERWKTRKAKGRKPWSAQIGELVTTQQLADGTPGGWGRPHPFSIPVCGPIETAARDLALDPYILGVWLGDGLSSGPKIFCGHEDAAEMTWHLQDAGCDVSVRTLPSVAVLHLDRQEAQRDPATGRMRLGEHGVRRKLRTLGILGKIGDCQKRIPVEYLRASVNQRAALLQGLMDTDGHIRPKDFLCQFISVLPELAEQVRELAVSLGIRVSVSRRESWISIDGERSRKRDSYSVQFRAPSHVDVFRLKRKLAVQRGAKAPSLRATRRKVVRVEPVESVPVRCIEVDSPSHLYLAGSAMVPTHNSFPGGHLTVAGSNAPASLASRPIRDLYLDEEDRYAISAGTEGDPVRMAQTRTRAFWNAKTVHISSPGVKGASRIEVVWMRSDQRFYYVPCHACGARQVLTWKQVAWEKDDAGEAMPETARYVCEACGEKWSDLQRRSAVKKGEWRATKPFRGCAGFHINALAAPWESCNLDKLVIQWLEAQGNPALLQVFINTVLAEWWEDEHFTKTVDETGLLSRREAFAELGGRPAVPAAAAVLTAGVDVQDGRFEISVHAWGAGEESWLLEHRLLYGDPSAESTWLDLDKYLMSIWHRTAGGIDYIRGIAVDTGGHFTAASYDFCGPRFRRSTADGGRQFVFAVKGMAGAGELWPRAASKAVTKVPLWPIRVDAGKEQIYGRLGIAQPGPGYVHFPTTVDIEFFKGLTAEKVVTRLDKKGFPRRTWEKKRSGIRNEPLDCSVYSYAALVGLRSMGFDLEVEVASLPTRAVVAVEAVAPTQVAPGLHQEQPSQPREERGDSGWLGDTSDWLRRR